MAESGRIIRGQNWGAALREQLAKPPADSTAWMSEHTQLLKSDVHSRVGLLQLGDTPCCLKLYLAKSRWQQLGFRLGYGRAIHSFDAAAGLAGAGLPVPEPRSCIEVAQGMLLLTEGIATSRDLRGLWLQQPQRDKMPELLQSAGRLLARLHSAGYAHGDCKWSNLLWSGDQFYLVDLETARKVGQGHPRLVRDLARFTIDAEELGLDRDTYELFLSAYLAGSGLSRDALIRRLRPLLEPIRSRHLSSYGTTSRPLI